MGPGMILITSVYSDDCAGTYFHSAGETLESYSYVGNIAPISPLLQAHSRRFTERLFPADYHPVFASMDKCVRPSWDRPIPHITVFDSTRPRW